MLQILESVMWKGYWVRSSAIDAVGLAVTLQRAAQSVLDESSTEEDFPLIVRPAICCWVVLSHPTPEHGEPWAQTAVDLHDGLSAQRALSLELWVRLSEAPLALLVLWLTLMWEPRPWSASILQTLWLREVPDCWWM